MAVDFSRSIVSRGTWAGGNARIIDPGIAPVFHVEHRIRFGEPSRNVAFAFTVRIFPRFPPFHVKHLAP